MKKLFFIPVILLVTWSFVLGAVGKRATTYYWTRPTSGNPVTQYRGYLSDDSGATWVLAGTSADTFMTVDQTFLRTYLFKVDGVDALGQASVFSPNSDPFTPDGGKPGAPGKPIRR